MAHKSNPARKGGQQPPFEIVLDEACSIVCDDVPSNCTIRVMQVDGRSPPRICPALKWVEDYSPDAPPPGEDGWSPMPRDKYGKSPFSSPMRSRQSIVESVRRNMQENYGGASSSGIHRGGDAEQDIFALRKPYCKHESQSPSPTPSVSSASSYSSASNRPSWPQSATSDRLLNSNRPQMNFRRTNIAVDGADWHEMHSNSGPSSPGAVQSKARNERPSPPSPARGGRCCRMADYQSTTSERDYSGGVSPSRAVSAGATCSFHGSEPCPARAGARCRANRAHQSSGSPPPRSPGLQGSRSCKYHDQLPCPALAGVPCRGEIKKSGTSSPSESRPHSPSPRDPNSPRYPGPGTRSQSPGRSAGVSYPPRSISPPPKSPRSRTPARRAPRHKSKGVSH